ncbi:MAG: hypothetical protein EBQ99_07330 [Planctomycetes bacterium]|nr:hypothetical protein [Planctomycetota bacterium]
MSAFVDAEDPRDVFTAFGFGPLRLQMDVGAQTLPAGDYWLQVTGVNANTAVTSLIACTIGAPFGEIWGDPDADAITPGVFEPLFLRSGRVPNSEANGTNSNTIGDRRFAYWFRPGLGFNTNGSLNTAAAGVRPGLRG